MLLNLGVTISEEELLVLLESTKSSISTKDFLGSRPNLLIESINITTKLTIRRGCNMKLMRTLQSVVLPPQQQEHRAV